MVIFQMFLLVRKFYKFGLFITTYYGHGQCFIWEFLVLAFIETERLNSSNFYESANDTNLVCKLYISSLLIKTLISDMSEILDNIYIDRFLLLAFVKYILSQIYSHCMRNCSFWYFLAILETCLLKKIFSKSSDI